MKSFRDIKLMSAVIGQLSQLSFVLKLSQTLFLPCGTEDKMQLTFLYVYIERDPNDSKKTVNEDQLQNLTNQRSLRKCKKAYMKVKSMAKRKKTPLAIISIKTIEVNGNS